MSYLAWVALAITVAGALGMIVRTAPPGDEVDPGPLSAAKTDAAFEQQKLAVDRFYRRRDLVWRIWIGVWGIPTILTALRPAGTKLDDAVVNTLGSFGLVVLALVGISGWWTVRASRRDHALGVWWRFRVSQATDMLAKGQDERWARREAGPMRVALDTVVPFVLTGMLYAGLIAIIA